MRIGSGQTCIHVICVARNIPLVFKIYYIINIIKYEMNISAFILQGNTLYAIVSYLL